MTMSNLYELSADMKSLQSAYEDGEKENEL
jgi:hypothetical protein